MSRGGSVSPRGPSGSHSTVAPSRAAELGLDRHPEGGWFRRTWTSSATVDGDRPTATAILFLLATGERSAWHVVDADEVWLWHGPGSLTLRLAETADGPGEAHVLDAGHPQVLVPAGTWQCTEPVDAEVLVTCVVSPGFTWAGFRLVRP